MSDRPDLKPRHAGNALLIALSMAQFMVVLDFTIVNVALPSIQQGMHIATSTVQWVVSGYAVAFGGFLLLGGRLADLLGRARLYRIGLVYVCRGQHLRRLGRRARALIGSRLVQGIGAAMLAPVGLSLLVTSWPGEQERSRALGTYGAIVSTGFASGAVLGGLLVEATWRLVFFVNVPVGVALLVTSIRLLPPDPPSHRGRLDVEGALSVTAGVAVLVLAVTQAGDTLSAARPALLGVVGALLLGAFVLRETRAESPLVDLALFTPDRPILGANLCLAALGAYTAGEVLVLTLYLQEGRHLVRSSPGCASSPRRSGPSCWPARRRSSSPLGPRRGLALAMSLGVLALAGGALAVSFDSIVALLAMLLLLGVASRLTQVAGTLAGTSGPIAAQSEGTASALLTATRQCGSALGVAILSALLVAAHGGTSHRTEVAMLVAACFALGGLLATLVIPAGPLSDQRARPEHRFNHHAGGVA